MTIASSLPVEPVGATQSEIGIGVSTAGYFRRHLHLTNDKGDSLHLDESEMLAVTGAKIVLGEPGMGKSASSFARPAAGLA